MFTDIVGYTALMAESEEKALRVRERHRELVRACAECRDAFSVARPQQLAPV